MRWYFKIKSKTGSVYAYYYSRESDSLDGVICFDTDKDEEPFVEIVSASDKGKPALAEWAVEHFWKVIREGFPEKRYVCCG